MVWSQAWKWADVAAKGAAKKAWKPSKAAEKRYAKQLSSVAKEVSARLAGGGTPAELQDALKQYAEQLTPWANQAAANMLGAARKKNEQTWREAANKWSIDLGGMLDADIDDAVREMVERNVLLIKSLPTHAAERVGEMAQKAVLNGTRAETLAKEIAKQGDVTMSRARTIAQTEVSKAQTGLTRARSEAFGGEGYIWRTARDGNRRPSHAAMEGRFVRWDSPPTLDGMTGHAGEFPNCRCYAEPVVHDSAGRVVASPLPTMAEEKESGSRRLLSHWERTNYNPVTPHRPETPLHNVERADFDLKKLSSYTLDPEHPVGKDKARVWKAATGFEKRHAEKLHRLIMEQLPGGEAVRGDHDQHGERFDVIVPIKGLNGRVVDVLTAWIYDRDNKSGKVSTKPRLITTYPM
jgi:SPP1 gp7 family putative phage head morphogenesis protein